VQEALNNAFNDGGGVVLIAAPPRIFYSSLPAHALKNPIKSDARSASFFCPSFKESTHPSFCQSALTCVRPGALP
jgi:hypothetical protein